MKMDMRPDNPLPNFVRAGGHRATFEYRGVHRLCWRCKLEGHIRAQSGTPHCASCGMFGHRTDTCTAAPRQRWTVPPASRTVYGGHGSG
ncbi:hypothetical protein HPB50_028892 [Hyalomma asiaticum]|nr:hypothetical protein HPB50_028892 [Hyalomma asiaticum]